jgi:hypothetical protein
MVTDEEVKEIGTDWLNWLAADFYDEGIVRLVQYLDKSLNRNGDYAKKQSYIVSSSAIKIIWMNKVFFCL